MEPNSMTLKERAFYTVARPQILFDADMETGKVYKCQWIGTNI